MKIKFLTKFNRKTYNFRLYILVLATSLFGLLIINSADSDYTMRQALGIAGATVWMTFVSLIDFKKILKHYKLWYILNIIALVAVLVVGTTALGAQRWIVFGPLRFQPSELSKVILVLFLAQLLYLFKDKLNTWKFLLFLAVILLIPIGLTLKEPDLSQSILTVVILLAVIFAANIPYKKIGIILAVVVPIVVIGLIYIQNPEQKLLKPYQWTRVMAFLKPAEYDASVYQQENSVTAIGSGGLTGKGLYNDDPTSLLNNDYIPEAHTDFIFAALGEELGFLGCMLALALLGAIVFECIRLAIKCRDYRGRLIAVGIATHICVQTTFNIGVVTQMLPNTGLALPFFSYGLSSTFTLFTAMGIMLNIYMQMDSQRDKDIYTKDFVGVKYVSEKDRNNFRPKF